MLKEEVGPDDIAEVVQAWTGIPAGRLLEGETQKLLRMEDELAKRVVGQPDAVRAGRPTPSAGRAPASPTPTGPTGSFLFLGPTGVGKTELAKALAEFLFDDERAMVRIDMSEYSEKHSVARLVGAPPGYVGYEAGGQLTEAVRRRPYTVVLLDEVEKAHPDVFDVLLQVLDDGRLTDGQGRTVDFRNTILILTSNLGSQLIADQSVPEEQPPQGGAWRSSAAHFKPEFLNRLDDVVVFRALGTEELAGIVDIQVGVLARRLAARRLTLRVTDAAREWLALNGFDPVYGARPLRRLVQSAIGDQLGPGAAVRRDPGRRRGRRRLAGRRRRGRRRAERHPGLIVAGLGRRPAGRVGHDRGGTPRRGGSDMTSDQGGTQGEPTGRPEGGSEPAAPQGWNAPPPPPQQGWGAPPRSRAGAPRPQDGWGAPPQEGWGAPPQQGWDGPPPPQGWHSRRRRVGSSPASSGPVTAPPTRRRPRRARPSSR